MYHIMDLLTIVLLFIVSAIYKFFTTIVSSFLLLILTTIAWRYIRSVIYKSSRRPINHKDVVLITGGTSGIGLALAKFLHSKGYSVIVGYYDKREPGFVELEELEKVSLNGGLKQRIGLVGMDIRDEESIRIAYGQCLEFMEKGNLKLIAIVNNAGLGSLQPFSWIQRKTIINLVRTNLLGSLLVTREFLPLLVKSKGRIVNVSSGLGVVPGPTYITYGITKCAQIYFTLALNQELEGAYGVKSVVVIPHNFIKNTNITSSNTITCENSWSELKSIEKELYEKNFKEHCQLSRELEEASKKHAKLVAEHKTKKEKQAIKVGQQVNDLNLSSLRTFLKPVIEFFDRLGGKNESLSLDESLECFEDAISLDKPGEHIFAGDVTYNLVVGSILLCLPSSCLKLLGKNIASSMYK